MKLLKYDDTIQAQKYITRRCSLYDYFYFHQGGDNLDPEHFKRQFTGKSSWTPSAPQLSDPTLYMISKINDSTSNLTAGKIYVTGETKYIKHRVKPNLTPTQLQTIKDLRNNTSIIIKPADKGGAIVVMATESYKAEVYRQLYNINYYRPLPAPLYPDTAKQLEQVLSNLLRMGFITNRQFDYLKPDTVKMTARYFYLLPKIHKPRESWPRPDMPAGRPIVSDCNSESSRICAYIDYHLQPLSVLHESYLKDTYDFINKIKGQHIDPNWLLITADVESLYTNMRLDIIIDVIREIFSEYPNPSRPDKHIIRLLEITLNNNDFEFNGDYFLQICGIAMGRKYAPSIANIYLRKFDAMAIRGWRIKPAYYSRFLDDIFGLWPGTREELLEYETFLNNLIPGIKVKFTARDRIIEFLDTQVYKSFDQQGACTLATKVYFKDTDTHQLLHRTSFHPKHTFIGIVKSQMIRFKRISTTHHDYTQAANTLINILRTRGYNVNNLRRTKRHIWLNYDVNLNRERNKENKREIIPVITHYDNFHWRLNKAWIRHIRDNPIFIDTRVVAAYKRHKNLRDLLVRGRFGNAEEEQDPEVLLDLALEYINKNP